MRYLLFFIIAFYSSGLFSQKLLKYNNNPKDFPRKYYAVSLGIGPRYLQTESGMLDINFYGQNNSVVNSFNESLSGSYLQAGFHIGLSMGKYTGFSHKLFLDISGGKKHGSGGLGYSLGFNFPFEIRNSYLLIRPGINGFIGTSRFKFLNISNPDHDLVIDGNEYTNSNVILAFDTDFLSWGPEIEFSYFAYPNVNIFLLTSYNFVNNTESTKVFKIFNGPDDESGQYYSAYDKNPSVKLNNKSLEKLPFKYGSILISAGASMVFNKN